MCEPSPLLSTPPAPPSHHALQRNEFLGQTICPRNEDAATHCTTAPSGFGPTMWHGLSPEHGQLHLRVWGGHAPASPAAKQVSPDSCWHGAAAPQLHAARATVGATVTAADGASLGHRSVVVGHTFWP